MVHGILPHTKGLGGLTYLFAEKDSKGRTRPSAPRILGRGDVELARTCILATPHAHKYASQYYSWSEPGSKVSDEEMLAVDDAYFAAFTGKQPPDDFGMRLRVRHERATGCDLHSLWSRLHLPTGVDFSYYPSTSENWELRHTLQRLTNLQHNWTDPGDQPSLRTSPPKEMRKEQMGAFTMLDDQACAKVLSGEAEDRDDLIALLIRDGYTVKAYKHSIAIIYAKRRYFFKGGKYDRSSVYSAYRSNQRTERRPDPDKVRTEITELAALADHLGSTIQKAVAKRFAGRDFSVPRSLSRVADSSTGHDSQAVGSGSKAGGKTGTSVASKTSSADPVESELSGEVGKTPPKGNSISVGEHHSPLVPLESISLAEALAAASKGQPQVRQGLTPNAAAGVPAGDEADKSSTGIHSTEVQHPGPVVDSNSNLSNPNQPNKDDSHEDTPEYAANLRGMRDTLAGAGAALSAFERNSEKAERALAAIAEIAARILRAIYLAVEGLGGAMASVVEGRSQWSKDLAAADRKLGVQGGHLDEAIERLSLEAEGLSAERIAGGGDEIGVGQSFRRLRKTPENTLRPLPTPNEGRERSLEP